jgi:phage RecT family recombinase
MTKEESSTKGQALAGWQEFEGELKQREEEFASMLPPNVDRNRFIASAIAAVKATPELLLSTKRSLFSALTKSAQDGLLPDGREGIIVVFNTNVAKGSEPDRWEKQAQWNPMVHGLRKRLREIAKIMVDAQVIYENDKFVWVQGDEPKIEHIPARLGTDRGEMIGAYAIFKTEAGVVLHREIMSGPEIQTTRQQSRAKESLMWTTFRSEGYRKTVIRRGIKTVPVSAEMTEIIKRDDEEHFDFENLAPATEQAGAFIPPRPQRSEFEPRQIQQNEGVVLDVSPRREADPVVVKPVEEVRAAQSADRADMRAAQREWYEDQKRELAGIKAVRDVAVFADKVEAQLFPDQIDEWNGLCDRHQRALIDALNAKR